MHKAEAQRKIFEMILWKWRGFLRGDFGMLEMAEGFGWKLGNGGDFEAGLKAKTAKSAKQGTSDRILNEPEFSGSFQVHFQA